MTNKLIPMFLVLLWCGFGEANAQCPTHWTLGAETLSFKSFNATSDFVKFTGENTYISNWAQHRTFGGPNLSSYTLVLTHLNMKVNDNVTWGIGHQYLRDYTWDVTGNFFSIRASVKVL